MFLVPLVQCLCSISLKILKGEMLGILGQDTEKKGCEHAKRAVFLFHRSKNGFDVRTSGRTGSLKKSFQMAICGLCAQRFQKLLLAKTEIRSSPSSTIWSEPRLLFRDQMLATWHKMTPPKGLLSKRYLMISTQVKQEEMYSIVNNIRTKVTHVGSNIFEFS